MRPVCKFYKNSECLNPNCRFLHPKEFPVYIYTSPGIEIHPDELRLALMMDPNMVVEVDNVWINNYAMFCQDPEEKDVDIVKYPNYFCSPLDTNRVSSELDKIDLNKKAEFKQERSQNFNKSFDRQGSNYNRQGGYNDGFSTNQAFNNDNRGFGKQFNNYQKQGQNNSQRFNRFQQNNDFGSNSELGVGSSNFRNNRFVQGKDQTNFENNKFQQDNFGGGFRQQRFQDSNKPSFQRNQNKFGGFDQQDNKFQNNRFDNQSQGFKNQNDSGWSRRESMGNDSMMSQSNTFSSSDFPNRFDRPNFDKSDEWAGDNDKSEYDYHKVPYSYK